MSGSLFVLRANDVLSYLSIYRPKVLTSLKLCNRSLVYAAPALWNGLLYRDILVNKELFHHSSFLNGAVFLRGFDRLGLEPSDVLMDEVFPRGFHCRGLVRVVLTGYPL